MIRRRRTALGVGVLAALGVAAAARAESPGCVQARVLVEEIAGALVAGDTPGEAVRLKLQSARNLCPSLAEAWVLSHCDANARGDHGNAGMFARQARFLGAEPACPRDLAPRSVVAPVPEFIGDKHALIVGIGSFRDPGIPPLRFAAKDARDLASALTDPRSGRFDPDNVTLLTDGEATRARILTALHDLVLRAREEDLVVLYLSSHGSPRLDGQGLGGVGYVVTHDTSPGNIWVDAIDYEVFSRQARWIRARRKVIFLDTCYSGLAITGAKSMATAAGVDAATAALFLSGEGSYVITSSRGDQRSYESETLENSYFTHYLLNAIRRPGDAPDLREVFATLAREVPAAVARDKGARQDPQFFPAEGSGDLRIGVACRSEGLSPEGPDGRPGPG